MPIATFHEKGVEAGCKTLSALDNWSEKMNEILNTYEDTSTNAALTEVNIGTAFYFYDLMADRVALAYAFSVPCLTKRDASRIRGFPNINATVKKVMGDKAFLADKGHFLGHASGGALDINLFPQRRDLNRGWSEQGKAFRSMERYVATHRGAFFYHRPIYDDDTWLPNKLEFAVLTESGEWWIELFNNK